MSAKQLCTLLEELGLRDDTHTPESLAWTCQQEGARLLIKWLCNNISKDNVLSLEELAEYNQLKQDGKVLQGEELEEAFWRLTRGSQEEEAAIEQAIQDTIEETEDLKEKAESLNRRLDRLQAQARALESQKVAVMNCTAGREHFVTDAKRQHVAIKAELAEQGQEINMLMDRIGKAAQQIELNYTGEGAGGRPQLLTTSFAPFLKQNEILQKELALWHQQQFEGRAAQDLEKDAAFTLPVHGEVEGQRESRYEQRVKELERLSHVFGRAEEQKILAIAERDRQEAALEMARTQLSANRRNVVESEASLRAKTAEMKALIAELESDEKRLKGQVELLCKELGQLNSTFVFEGDYELKRQRQEHYLEQYHQFIGHLADQLACHLVLLQACNLEKQAHREVCSLMRAAQVELEAVASSAMARTETYKAFTKVASELDDGKPNTLQDPLIRQLGALLEVSPGTEAGEVSSNDVIQGAEELEGQLGLLRERVDILRTRDRDSIFLDLSKSIEHAHALLYSGPFSDHPEFTPEDVLKSVEELDTLSSSLETAVERIQSRQKRLHHVLEDMGGAMEVERRVFVDFFCNPDRLRATMHELEQAAECSRPKYG